MCLNKSLPGVDGPIHHVHPSPRWSQGQGKGETLCSISLSSFFFFCAHKNLRIPELIHPNCSMWQRHPLICLTVESDASWRRVQPGEERIMMRRWNVIFCVLTRLVLFLTIRRDLHLFLFYGSEVTSLAFFVRLIPHTLQSGRTFQMLNPLISEQQGRMRSCCTAVALIHR